MPWKEKNVLDIRTDFVFRATNENVSFKSLCEEYGISRTTGYKWLNRFIEDGLSGLEDRSKAPNSSPNQLDENTVTTIIKLKLDHLTWGPKKIKQLYARIHPTKSCPSESTFKRIFTKVGLVSKRKRRSVNTKDNRLINRFTANSPNDIWTIDFKGWWMTSDGLRCEPLTVRDDFSKMVLLATPTKSSKTEDIKKEFVKLFKNYGLPKVIRSDNGCPFANVRALWGLTKFSAWLIAQGIKLDRIPPGKPYFNGGHERMHRDMKMEVQAICKGNFKQQKAALELWREEFNNERPHEALEMRTPAEIYVKSERKFKTEISQLKYPKGFIKRKVNTNGIIMVEGEKYFLTTALRGWNIALKPIKSGKLEVWFDYIKLGIITLETRAFKSIVKCKPCLEPN